MFIGLILAASASTANVDVQVIRYDYSAVEEEVVAFAVDPAASIEAHTGAEDSVSELPQSEPMLPLRGSNSSVIVRARDVFDLSLYPARAVAKLFQLDETGTRTGNSCTAQFIGPRHLITATHCLLDGGAFRPGQELEIGYDNGEGVVDPVPLVAAWVLTADLVRFRGSDDEQRAWAENPICNDLALVEIADPLGVQYGWFGLRPPSDSAGQALHYNFSYPQSSRAQMLERTLASDEDLPPPVREAFEDMLASIGPHTPEFSNQNMYFSYGVPDELDEDSLYVFARYTLSGISGSALIDGEFDVAGIRSTWAGDHGRYCRPQADWVGTAAAIIQRSQSVRP